MKLDATAIILIVIIIGAIFVLPMGISAFLRGVGDFWNTFWAPFTKNLGNQTSGFWNQTSGFNDTITGGSLSGYMNMGLIITYDDGSTKEFTPTPTWSLLPLSITDAQTTRVISNVQVVVRANLVYNGALTAWSSSTTISLKDKVGTTRTAISTTNPLTNTGTSWASASTQQIAQNDYGTTVLENAIKQLHPTYGAGSMVYFEWTADTSLTATLGGTDFTKTASGGPTTLAVYYYPAGIQSLTVTIVNTPI